MPKPDRQTAALIKEARFFLKATHRTYRSAAEELGVSYQHLSYVLNAQRKSLPLLKRILDLPKYRPVEI